MRVSFTVIIVYVAEASGQDTTESSCDDGGGKEKGRKNKVTSEYTVCEVQLFKSKESFGQACSTAHQMH